MKAVKSIILVCFCLAAMTACQNSQVSEIFSVVEVTQEDSLLINNSDKGDMSLYINDIPIYKGGEKVDNYSFNVGEEIEVVFDGLILETYPAQFSKVYRINISD